MKRGTPKHPKLENLCERLKVRRPLAMGFLELLWHFTAEFAPQGDIGKYSDKRIEAAMEWGSGPTGTRWERPGALISGLCAERWIDDVGACDVSPEGILTPSSEAHGSGMDTASTPHGSGMEGVWTPHGSGMEGAWMVYPRLIVHDWEHHADDSVSRKLDRAHLPFLRLSQKVTGKSTVTDGNLSASRARVATPKPEPRPKPEPQPPPPTQEEECVVVAANGVSVVDRFTSWFALYRGRKANPNGAAEAWASLVTGETVDAAFACTVRYNGSAEVARGVCMEAKKFIETQSKVKWLGNWQKPAPRVETVNDRRRREVIAGIKAMRGEGPTSA